MVWLFGLVLCRAGAGLWTFWVPSNSEYLRCWAFPRKGPGGSGRHWVNPSQQSAIVTGTFVWSCYPVGWPQHILMLAVIPSLGRTCTSPYWASWGSFWPLKGISPVPGWAWTTNLSVNSWTRSPIVPQRPMCCTPRGAEFLTVFTECCWWCLCVLNNNRAVLQARCCSTPDMLLCQNTETRNAVTSCGEWKIRFFWSSCSSLLTPLRRGGLGVVSCQAIW